jgi:hypothetical protein
MKIAKDVVCDRETNSYGYVGAPLCGVIPVCTSLPAGYVTRGSSKPAEQISRNQHVAHD